jgi:hypothetical protein
MKHSSLYKRKSAPENSTGAISNFFFTPENYNNAKLISRSIPEIINNAVFMSNIDIGNGNNDIYAKNKERIVWGAVLGRLNHGSSLKIGSRSGYIEDGYLFRHPSTSSG